MPTPVVPSFSMARRRKPIARSLGGWLLRGARARKRSTEDRVDMALVLVMGKEGQSDIERPIFDSVLTAQLYSLYSKIGSAYMTLACCI